MGLHPIFRRRNFAVIFQETITNNKNKAGVEPVQRYSEKYPYVLKASTSMYINGTLTLVLASILAPRSSSSFTILAFPLFDATCKGVMSFCGRREKNYSLGIFCLTKHCFLKCFQPL